MKRLLLSFAVALTLSATAWAEQLPYSQSFDTSAGFQTMTLLNVGEDPRDWDWSSNAARFYPSNRYNAYNAWFFTPALDLEAGKTYVVTFKTKISSSSSSNYKDLYVSYGQGCTVEGQTQLWMENIQSSSYSEKKLTITPDASGAYNIGFHTEATSGSMNDLLVDDILIKEYVELPAAATDLIATPADKGVLSLTLSWTNPSLNDGGSALSGLSGARVYRTDSSWVTMGEGNLVATITDGIAPGAVSTWTDNTIDKAGVYYYQVVPFNDNGPSVATPTKVKSGFVGPDSGIGKTQNVVAAAVEGNEKAILLTWDAPKGANGGYIDPANVGWRITRKANSGEASVLEEAWKGNLPYAYTDATIPGLDAYTYTVQYVYSGATETSGANSNTVVTGGTASLPYADDFSSSLSPTYTQIADGGKKWTHSSYSGYPYFQASSTAKEAWLITPPFELKKGVAYDIDYQTWISSTNYPKNMALTVGGEATAEAQTTVLADDNITATTSNADAKKSVRYVAKEDGVVYFGFHTYGTSTSGSTYLDNISIKEVLIVPEAATGLTAIPDADDNLAVSLSWTNPAVDILGNALTSIDKIEVYRGDLMIKKYANAAPGAAMTLTDDGIEQRGIYTYKVVAYLGQNAGAEAVVSSGLVGGAIPLPYTADFSSAETFDFWAMPANSSSKSWSYNSSSSRLEAPDSDDLWLFTPQFKAEKGIVTLKLTGQARSSSYKETIKVALYSESNASAEAITEPVEYTFSSTSSADAEFNLNVDLAGKYYIGIHRPKSGWQLYLTAATIEQTKTVNDNAPLAPTSLNAEGDADDETKVNLSWVNPTQTVGGADVAITKIEVLRDGEVIATLDGDATTYTDTLDEPGKYTYSVVAFAGDNASDPATFATGFIGGTFSLPYTADFTAASTFDVWNFPANDSGKSLKYNASSQALETNNDNVSAESPLFNAKKGTVEVTISAKTSSWRWPTNITVNLLSNDKDVIDTADYLFDGTYSEVQTLAVDIPADGKYYVEIMVTTAGLPSSIDGFSVAQTAVDEPIMVYWDNTEAAYAVPAVAVDGGEPIVMTCIWDGTMPTERRAAKKIFEKDVFYAEIPSDAQKVVFLDNGNAAPGTEIEGPEHNHIYKLDGSSKPYNPDDVTAIEGVIAESYAAPVYFNLQGVRIAAPAAGQAVIVVRDGKASKVISF